MDKNLFDDNIDTAYKHLAVQFPNLACNEDARQEALIALWKASETYTDDGRADFATYAKRCITNHILKWIDKDNRRIQTISLQSYVQESGVELQDTLFDDASYLDNAILECDFEIILGTLPYENDRRIARLIKDGVGKKAAMSELGITETEWKSAHRRISNAFHKYEREM